MLQALRLINPPGRRRRKASAKKAKSWPKYATGTSSNKPKPKRRKTVAKPIKTVRTARGVRYMRGGKFISKAAAKRSRAAKRRAKTTAAPKKRKRSVVKKKTAPKKVVHKVRRKTTPKKDPRRVAAGKKAARTRKRKAAAKRKKTTTKRRKPVAKRKDPKRVRAGKKAARTRARKKAARKTAAKKAARKRTRKAPAKRKVRRKRKVARKRAVRTVRLTKPGTKKRKTYKIMRRKRRYTVKSAKRNPMKTMKSALMKGAAFWAGLTGMRVINNALKIHVTDRFAASIPAQIAPLLPSLAGFVASTVIVPRVTKKKAFVDALQMGATVAMIDAVFNQFVRPNLPISVAPYLAGYGEMTVYEPVAEYVDYDNRLGDVAEYVPDNRYGQFMVTEALAADEIEHLQRGGAGGIFAKTTLGRG